MEKKIGLFAPYESTNYGTLLQAFALSRVINGLGCRCEYVAYSHQIKRSLLDRIVQKIKRIMHISKQQGSTNSETDDYRFVYTDDFKPLREVCNMFAMQYIPYSSKRYNSKTIQQSVNDYRCFIVGSDQTWSMERYQHLNGFFFLPFVKDFPCYAYAPSLGTTTISSIHRKILKKHLCKFKSLSCREMANCKAIEQMLNRKVVFAVDPTMLLTAEEWRKIADYSVLPTKYILAYILGEKKSVATYAEALGMKLGLPVYYVPTRPKYLQKSNCLPISLCPSSWIGAIDKATCVVTDSFHGCLFSINLGVDFYAFTKRFDDSTIFNDNDRIMELLRTFNLTDRFVYDNFVDVKYEPISYDKVQHNITLLRNDSLKYIKHIVSA